MPQPLLFRDLSPLADGIRQRRLRIRRWQRRLRTATWVLFCAALASALAHVLAAGVYLWL
jgi:hypothetical protein